MHGEDIPNSGHMVKPQLSLHLQWLTPAFLFRFVAHVSLYKQLEIVPFQATQVLFRSSHTQKSSCGCVTKGDPSHYQKKIFAILPTLHSLPISFSQQRHPAFCFCSCAASFPVRGLELSTSSPNHAAQTAASDEDRMEKTSGKFRVEDSKSKQLFL